ncbi:condensation domain-containing protein [Maribacter flavus]|uniref:Condensation domain-containing protein n=1 Tax=Maribacter flavus TaxID=1658664 RepID=A0A5B2TN24_9FLAO|nr:condensation domain-containing protein [Maribacter flavus]KAA2215806.1 hypothetical protein F0361_16555 [Maribacter flavus]
MLLEKTNEKEYLPFVRQIKDWHRYNTQGNSFVERGIKLVNFNKKKIHNTIYSLLHRQEILRSIFYKSQNGLIINKLLEVENDLFKPVYIIGDNFQAVLDNIKEDNEKVSLTRGPLFRSFIIEIGQTKYLMFFVHHMICSGSSMNLLIKAFIDLYKNEKSLHTVMYQFRYYTKYTHRKIFDRYDVTSTFLTRNLKLPISKKNALNKVYNPIDQEKLLTDLSNENHYVIVDSPKARPLSITTYFKIENLEEVVALLEQKSIHLMSFFLVPYLKLIRKFYGNHVLVGLLFDDRYNVYSKKSIGEYTGESFISVNSEENLSLSSLLEINSEVIKLSRHLIFNYNLYGVDEKLLYRDRCVGFFNFSKSSLNYNPEEQQCNDFRKIKFVGLRLEPVFNLYTNGYLTIDWRFDGSQLSREKVKDLFENYKSLFYALKAQILTSI